MRKLIVAAVTAIVAGAGVAAAQLPGMSVPSRRLIRFGFGGGVSVPTQNAADALKTGVNGQAYLLIDTGMLPPIRFNLGMQRFTFDGPSGGGEASSILSGVGGFSMNLITLGPVRTYITAGLGAFNISQTSAGGASTTKFGVDAGGGLSLRLGRLEAFVEGRVQNVYTDAGFVNSKNIQSVPVTFGILF